eukprot:2973690-Alexandrium_andersonii.AAC.1
MSTPWQQLRPLAYGLIRDVLVDDALARRADLGGGRGRLEWDAMGCIEGKLDNAQTTMLHRIQMAG